MIARQIGEGAGEYISMLSKLYAALDFYPGDPPLNGYEVTKLDRSWSGGFGGISEGLFLGEHRVALKYHSPSTHSPRWKRRFDRETRIWRQLRHPNVLRFIGPCVMSDTIYLVSPWMDNGGAVGFLKKSPNADCLRLLVQVAEGLDYLHASHVVHGDLKGSNVLVSGAGDAVIADFGLADISDEEDNKYVNSTAWLVPGNLRWQAPEPISAETMEEIRRTTKTDMFAFGRLAIEFITREAPFYYSRLQKGFLPALF